MVSRERLLAYLLWATCGLAVLAAAVVLVLPLGGGVNRLSAAALPFLVAAAAAAVLAYWTQVERWLSLVLYAVGILGLTYGLMVVGSLPLRLTVLGTCPAPPLACPTGFEPAMTGRETLALDFAVALGVIGLLCAVAAMETRYRPRLRIIGRSPGARTPEAASPPPEMKPSAIPKKPAGEPAKQGSGGDPRD